MAELPAGTVTFVFTDIEGSTRLLQELGDEYADALAAHRRVLRDAFARHGGVEVDTQGDSFFVAFGRASDALAAAREAQCALDGPVRVRIGVHTGEPLLTSQGYVGLDVHRAARIAAAGHGGQILVSQSTRDLVRSDDLRDLGAHRLKDLTAPERIYQLGDAEFPPLKALARADLPVALSPLIGRERELDELRALVSKNRLVTITGAGGSGKTRLAMQVAAEVADDVRDGAFFIPLAPIQDPQLVGATIAQHTGVRTLDDLRDAEALLVIDNVEHLLGAAGDITSLLSTAAMLKLLLTSRVRLQIGGEIEYVLDPLAEEEAIEFFLARARSAKRDVRYEPVVRDICRRLDGLPLALELAASRLKVLDPALLLERLTRTLPVLTAGARDAPERQRTLRATIEWTYELLDPRLQEAFRRLTIFRGTFSLHAAETVAGADLDDVATLVDWNLVRPIGQGRFLILETIREYGLEQLAANGEEEELRNRHLDFFLALADEAEPHLTGANQRDWYDVLRTEHDNLREALTFACDSGDGERALMLAGTIWRFWWNRGYVAEAVHWYERAFEIGADASSRARARAMLGLAHMDETRADAAMAERRFEEAARLFDSVGDARWRIVALVHLIGYKRERGDVEEAMQLTADALALAVETGDVRAAALITLNEASRIEREGGDAEVVNRMADDALMRLRGIGDLYGTASALALLGQVALRSGATEAACGYLHESIELSRSIGDTQSFAANLALAASAAFARGRADVSAKLWAAHEALCEMHGFDATLQPWLEDIRTAAARTDADESELDLERAMALALEAVA